jgi:predicted molibdopterin-dependent oxidoreductase YjgC
MSESVGVKTLLIDGQEVSARAGQTILEVARENDIYIPTLCHLDGLTDVGACRLCVVVSGLRHQRLRRHGSHHEYRAAAKTSPHHP